MILFNSIQAKKNFSIQISKASGLVRMAAKVGIFLSRVSRGTLDGFPVFKILINSANSLVSMHNVAAKSGLMLHDNFKGSSENCGFSYEESHLFELVVVGSGPGSAPVVQDAMEKNLDFLIVERGDFVDRSIISHSVDQMNSQFKNGGQEVVLSYPIVPFAQGETVGGGSQVNSGLYHNLPNLVKKEWLRTTNLNPEYFSKAEKEVFRSLKVETQSDSCLGIYQKSPILNMKELLNWDGAVIPRWRQYLSSTEYIHHGIYETYFASIPRSKILAKHKVKGLRLKNDHVEIALAGQNCSHNLVAKSVCLAAGTIGTPEILMRSGFAHFKDFTFQFHAMVRQVARFNYQVNDLQDIDPHQIWSKDYSFKLGAAVGTPELLMATLASKGVKYEGDLRELASFYLSTPSNGVGKLIRTKGHVYPIFLPSRLMRRNLNASNELLNLAIKQVGGDVLGTAEKNMSTVHIFGSIPLGKSQLIDELGYLRLSSKKIFLSDASLIPTHPLVNPQGPLMHLVTSLVYSRNMVS